MKDNNSSADLIGQNTIKIISNVGFSVFVFSVLTFTVIAITYQPPDPWESSRALTKVFTDLSNATFQMDNSIVKTGEDVVDSVSISPSAAPADAPLAQPDPLVKNSGENIVNLSPGPSPISGLSPSPSPSPGLGPSLGLSPGLGSGGCDENSLVNCSARGVLNAIKKFNVKRFKSIVFLEYQTPVNGSNPNECDVSWKYRNKKEKSWRKYRDFRRFRLGYGENCTYKVVGAKGWHSGVNAKRPRSQSQVSVKRKGEKAKPAIPFHDDEINDTIPVIGSSSDFRNGKYLYYSRGGDRCKNMNQYIWSLLCALGEARYLNRTFVMDLSVCLASRYTSSKQDEDGKDFRFYFDFEHLKETASIVEEREFLKDWKKFEKTRKKKITVRKVKSYKVTPMQLRNDSNTIIWRRFDGPEREPENYWYRVCENQAANYIKRPWQSLWKSKRLMNIVSEISGQMDWDYDAVHVIRGEKAQNKAMWPHLNEDTSPESLVSKLQGVIQPWRNLYIATNEPFYNHFDRLRSYYKVHLLDDYKDLWGNKSEWYNETMALNGGRPVVFDGYMRAEVDTEVLYRAKIQVETFYNLTKDCKDGINSC
ncbi:hypothetical protein QVD17_00985 [Tagetes erecta]|uniref:O-fucosyltransferase family protein n=1 Tax=Tagetes erecta TaxID=13708 RepID=A0AAD8L452_TARER|nr:hypothetical protein QVD17_00985 [Tagetes erecta]